MRFAYSFASSLRDALRDPVWRENPQLVTSHFVIGC